MVTVLLRLQKEGYHNFWNLKKHGTCVATGGQEKPLKVAGGYIGMCIQYKNWKVQKIKENMFPFKMKRIFHLTSTKGQQKIEGNYEHPP